MAHDAAIALDLGGTDLKAGLVGRDGSLVEFFKLPSRTYEGADAPLAAVSEAVARLSRPSATPIVGLGCPGVIDPARGTLVGRTAHLPHWSDFPLRETLEARLGRPVRVDNDANLAALAESRLGAARGTRVSVTITLGTGIGCGIVVDGRVLRGAFGGAGELGHLPLGGNTPCACGIPGCPEPEASMSGLRRAALAMGLAEEDPPAVFAAAAAGDPTASGLIAHMADRLGAVLAVAVNVLNPEVVVVGGGGAKAGDALLDPVRHALERYSLPSHQRGLRVVPALLGERAGTIGAGLLAWEDEM
jgi:glucokinase